MASSPISCRCSAIAAKVICSSPTWQRSAAISGSRRSTHRACSLIALMLTAYAMAISSTLCGAVLVENGQRLHESGTFVNQQWLWFNIAADGGRDHRRPARPASAAEYGACTSPRGIVGRRAIRCHRRNVGSIPEQKTSINLQGMKRHARRTYWRRSNGASCGSSPSLFFYTISARASRTPLYYHMTDNLKFSQGYIGILGIDRVGRLGGRRAALSAFLWWLDAEKSAQRQHRVRHGDHRGVPFAARAKLPPPSSISAAAFRRCSPPSRH